MELSNTRAALSHFHIDLLSVFFERQLYIASSDNLARIKEFINTFILFDTIYLPRTFSSNKTIQHIKDNIFIFDKDVNGLSDELYVDLSLDFKNSFHLRKKSKFLAEQSMVFNANLLERRKLIQFSENKDMFYYILLEQYKSLQVLSLKNDAVGMLSPALAQVYPINTMEVNELISFLNKENKTNVDSNCKQRSFGNFIFDIPELESILTIKLPNFFEEFLLNIDNHSDINTALIKLRKSYEFLRKKFRKLIFDVKNTEVTTNYRFDLKSVESDWEAFIKSYKPNCDLEDMVLRKQGTIMIDLNENLGSKPVFSDIQKHISNFNYHYKLISTVSFDKARLNNKLIETLNVREIIYYDHKKIFNNNKKYLNFNKINMPGLASTIVSSITSAAQIRQTDFGDKTVLDFCDKYPPYLYMICTRPKISVNPKFQIYFDRIELYFEFNYNGIIEGESIYFPRDSVQYIEEVNYPYTELIFVNKDGEKRTRHTSMLYQKILKEAIVDQHKTSIILSEMGADIEVVDLSLLARTDLKVEYIGKAYGAEGSRIALDRVKNHERLQDVYSYVINQNPSLEIWILLLPLDSQTGLQMLAPSMDDHIGEVEEFIHRSRNPVGMDMQSRVNFTEAALINYFSPNFNEYLKKSFPSKNHTSYEKCYSLPIDFFVAEIKTQDSLGCRLYSDKVKPKFVHINNCQFNSFLDKEKFFSTVNS